MGLPSFAEQVCPHHKLLDLIGSWDNPNASTIQVRMVYHWRPTPLCERLGSQGVLRHTPLVVATFVTETLQ